MWTISCRPLTSPTAKMCGWLVRMAAFLTSVTAGVLSIYMLTQFDTGVADSHTVIDSVDEVLVDSDFVVGGLGSVLGAIFGAIFVGLLPQGIAILRDMVPAGLAQVPGLEPIIFGLILIFFLIYEPQGIYGRWCKVRLFFEEFPLYRKSTYKRQKSFLRTERLQ